MQERWKICEDFASFAISNFGRVEDRIRSKLIPTRTNKQGFLMVTVHDGVRQHTRSVGLLAAKAFVPLTRLKHFTSIIHLNGDRLDCRAMNLMWRSRPYAMRYHSMFEEEPYRVSVKIPETGEFFNSLRDACTTYGLIESVAYEDLVNGRQVFPYTFTMEKIDI